MENEQAEGPFWGTYRRKISVSLAVLGLGIVLVSIGLPNEARLRPYYECFNCHEEEDIEGFIITVCECEPPEYELFMAMIVLGFILAGSGVIYFALLRYVWIHRKNLAFMEN
nr:hypothetical protein [Candidatus Sigynarchaeota archaeon]